MLPNVKALLTLDIALFSQNNLDPILKLCPTKTVSTSFLMHFIIILQKNNKRTPLSSIVV